MWESDSPLYESKSETMIGLVSGLPILFFCYKLCITALVLCLMKKCLCRIFGHQMAFMNRCLDGLSKKESETHGINFPCNIRGHTNQGKEHLTNTGFRFPEPEMLK